MAQSHHLSLINEIGRNSQSVRTNPTTSHPPRVDPSPSSVHRRASSQRLSMKLVLMNKQRLRKTSPHTIELCGQQHIRIHFKDHSSNTSLTTLRPMSQNLSCLLEPHVQLIQYFFFVSMKQTQTDPTHVRNFNPVLNKDIINQW